MIVVPSFAESQKANDESVRWANVSEKYWIKLSSPVKLQSSWANFSNGFEPHMCDTELIDQVMWSVNM